MSCGECKHWMPPHDSAFDRKGACKKFTSQYKAPEDRPEAPVEEVPKFKRRRGKAEKTAGFVYVTWGFDDYRKPGEPRAPGRVTSLGVVFRTFPEFSCALFERTKRKRRLPVVTTPGAPLNRLERVVAEED